MGTVDMGTVDNARLVSLLTLALALGAFGCNGQGAKGGCEALPICGGNPAGSWTLANGCEFAPVRPAQPVDVIEFATPGPSAPTLVPPQPNAVVAQQTTSGDWCSSLVLNPDGTVSNANLWHDAPQLTKASVKLFDTDHSYLTALTFETEGLPAEANTTHFAPRCLVANGFVPPANAAALTAACTQLKDGLTAFYKPQMDSVPPNFQDINCTPSDDLGCTCTYHYHVEVADQGGWAVDQSDPTTLLQDSMVFTYNGVVAGGQSPAATIRTKFCVDGGLLELTGYNGGSLSGLLGLRTITLSPAPATP
jgi:hypothetical protein